MNIPLAFSVVGFAEATVRLRLFLVARPFLVAKGLRSLLRTAETVGFLIPEGAAALVPPTGLGLLLGFGRLIPFPSSSESLPRGLLAVRPPPVTDFEGRVVAKRGVGIPLILT